MVETNMRINYVKRLYVPFYINFYVQVLTEFSDRGHPSLTTTLSEAMGRFQRLVIFSAGILRWYSPLSQPYLIL